MTFYHVSNYVSEGQILTRNTKNNYETCVTIENYDVSSFKKLKECYENLCQNNILKLTGRDAYKWCTEAIFEYIRKIEFSNMPNRIFGIYLCNSIQSAVHFNNKYRGGNAKIFKIEIVNYICPLCFDMKLFSYANEVLTKSFSKNNFTNSKYNEICNIARNYWSRKSLQDTTEIEFITDNNVIIKQQINIT